MTTDIAAIRERADEAQRHAETCLSQITDFGDVSDPYSMATDSLVLLERTTADVFALAERVRTLEAAMQKIERLSPPTESEDVAWEYQAWVMGRIAADALAAPKKENS